MKFEGPNNHKHEIKTEETKNSDISRRGFLRKALGVGTAVAATAVISKVLPGFEKEQKEKEEEEGPILVYPKKLVLREGDYLEEEKIESRNIEGEDFRELIDCKKLRKIKPKLKYEKKSPRLKVENLRLPDDISRYGATTVVGKMLSTLRYKNITDAVEDRYNLPKGILLAMIMEESTGVDLLPNARGDGGFGLCHMQASTAKEYGLKTYCNCGALVCNGKDRRSCMGKKGELKNHAKDLAEFVKNNSNNRKLLVEADERLNILLNIDAAGRMLAVGIALPPLSGELSDLDPLRAAIARYAGAHNFKNYWADVVENIKKLKDPKSFEKLEKIFNKRNPNLQINGRRADYREYLRRFQEQHNNYGLAEYKQLPKYLPNNTASVLKKYRTLA